MINPPIISLKALSKSFSQNDETHVVLKHIDLNIHAGEIIGIIGESGAGKSTLLRCINRLEEPTSGEIHVAGQSLTRLSKSKLRDARQQIGMIFQQFNLFNAKTVAQNIAFPLQLVNTPESVIAARITELLTLVGLESKADAYPAQLSGGQKQRVAIARALASKPSILLSDEATSALDPQTTEQILELLKTIRDQLGLTIVIVTHEMNVIKHTCDRVAIMSKGEIVECGPVKHIFFHAQHATTKELLSQIYDVRLPDDIQSKLKSVPSQEKMPVLQLFFHGKSAMQPIITQLGLHFNVAANILHANLESVQDELLGMMVLLLQIQPQTDMNDILDFLTKQEVRVEVMGYV